MRTPIRLCLPVVGCLSTVLLAADVDFRRDVRPILTNACYACHGPDSEQRQGGDAETGGLHFDSRSGAFVDLGGYFAIVPGEPDRSEMIRRINTNDPDQQMPPPDHARQLTRREKQVLADWIRQGANWEEHWAYVPPFRTTPQTSGSNWTLNFIDDHVLARLNREGLEPSPEADRRTLLRRLSFDLVGLPPDPMDVRAFLVDESPQAYELAVDRLLDSPHYGERMAMHWLDLVRYADSVGYHGDQPVSVSPYRDYVIRAFNTNMRYDQFTREQLAGDLLPDPTQDQLIASGYNRLGMMSAEGGVQPKEYLAKYASDRVRTASAVWLGSTLGCAECHDHKYDPFTTKDFYRFASFFGDIKERGLYSGAHRDGRWGPTIELPHESLPKLLAPIDRELAQVQKELDTPIAELAEAQLKWERQPATAPPENIQAILTISVGERTDEQLAALAAHYRSIAPALQATRERLKELTVAKEKIVKEHTRTSLITVAVEPRQMRILPRGNWMDETGEVVHPGVPHFLKQLSDVDRATRLDLANWISDRDNPLTARAFVNRLWSLYFGAGLSSVLDDLGVQGEPPSHPQLLDALAVEFMDSGWNVKHLIKLIVMSRTYRQSSSVSPPLGELDPNNRLVARQSRFRLDAELIRDNALAVSGLLVRRIGGRSVRPYQPPGLYRHLNFPVRTYQADDGDNQYRRGVYTHWQRQFLHPAMKAFDAPPREECAAQRPRSNTPLAALVLLNDPSYVEAARVFAQRVLLQVSGSRRDRIDWLMQQALARDPNQRETTILSDLVQSHLGHYRHRPSEARKLIDIGHAPVPTELEIHELAAWTSVARTVFNLHEFIARN